MRKRTIPIPPVPPQFINHMNEIEEKVHDIYRKVTYIEKIIRDHEEEDWCEHES